MAENNGLFLEGPIAGMGLTHELGGRPWQKPPQYVTVDEALEYYLPKFSDPEILDNLLDVMELGIPLTTIADGMQSAAVMEGLHTIDVGMLVVPVLIEMMAYIGDDAGIEYDLGMEERPDEDKIPESKVALAIKKVRNKLPEELRKAEEADTMDEAEPVEVSDEPVLSGLMARKM